MPVAWCWLGETCSDCSVCWNKCICSLTLKGIMNSMLPRRGEEENVNFLAAASVHKSPGRFHSSVGTSACPDTGSSHG